MISEKLFSQRTQLGIAPTQIQNHQHVLRNAHLIVCGCYNM